MKREVGVLGLAGLILGLRGEKSLSCCIVSSLPQVSADTPSVSSAQLPPLRIIGTTSERIMEALQLHEGQAYADWVRQLSKRWQGIPYGSGGNGLGPDELLLNLNQVDCMTAIENLLALHQAYIVGTKNIQGFAKALVAVRYQAAPPCRWEDRYHYLTHAFTKWERMGWGVWLPLGLPDNRPIHYISQNPQKYRGFKDWVYIRSVERELTTRTRYYIPSALVREWLPMLRDGDFVAFIPSQEGLDVSHVGVFLWEGERATFSHASLSARKWVHGEDLCAYLDRRRDKIKGITVFRPF
ncbi:MAG: DUF1460 domain-containing protein [Bacteroidia bacterium]|nr:DUF1460 domain-containing protein [Bacteroidia bacterium]